MSKYSQRLVASVNDAIFGWGRVPQFIKPIQAGTISITSGTSATAPLTAVVMSNALVIFTGFASPGTSDEGVNTARLPTTLELTNSTTLTATVGSAIGSGTRDLSYAVLEFYPGVIRGIQRGSIAVTGAASGTAPITAVQTLKSSVFGCGLRSTLSGGNLNNTYLAELQSYLVLTNATTVTATLGGSPGAATTTVPYQVLELN